MEADDIVIIKRVIAIIITLMLIAAFIAYSRLMKKIGRTFFYSPSDFLTMMKFTEFYVLLAVILFTVFVGIITQALQHG
jgi:hypothetical protein